MGNAALRKIPDDLTRCSEMQLRCMINSVIINNPWNDDEDESDENALQSTIDIMHSKGFRPITPQEYVEELKRVRKLGPRANQGIKVWLPVENGTWEASSANDDRRYGSYSTNSTPNSGSSAAIFSVRNGRESHSHSNKERVIDLCLPSSKEDATFEIQKSGVSAAILSELTDEEDILTEEWPTNDRTFRLEQQYP